MQNIFGTTMYKSLIAIQPDGTKTPFFCVHAGCGTVLSYAALACHLGLDQPFYLLQSVGIAGDDEPLTSVEAMASLYISELKTVQPAGPYSIGGFRTGAFIALEIAHQLTRDGDEVSLLAFIDVTPDQFGSHSSNNQPMKINTIRTPKRFLWNAVHDWASRRGRPMPRFFWDIDLATEHAQRTYCPHHFSGTIAAFIGEDVASEQSQWNGLSCNHIDISTIQCKREVLLAEPGVHHLARELSRSLVGSPITHRPMTADVTSDEIKHRHRQQTATSHG